MFTSLSSPPKKQQAILMFWNRHKRNWRNIPLKRNIPGENKF